MCGPLFCYGFTQNDHMVMRMVTSESTGVKEDMITYDNSKENQRQVRHPILSPVTRPWLQRTPPNNEAASARSSLKMQPQNSGKLQQFYQVVPTASNPGGCWI